MRTLPIVRHMRFGLVALVAVWFVAAPGLRAEQAAAAAKAGCSLSWVGQEAQIEEFLKTAPVAKMETVPIGVTKPRRALFGEGGLVARAAWKPLPPAYRQGFHESYKAEIAAYLLDRLLEMKMVPPTVERKVDGSSGAMMYWIENTHPWDMKKPPSGPEPGWSHMISRMKLFDQLIGNIDRNQGNLLYDDDWHLFLIDHSRAFIEKKDLKGMAAPVRVDKDLWDRMAKLTPEAVSGALGQLLTQKEIDAMMTRRDRMRDDIAKMVAERGEANVFF